MATVDEIRHRVSQVVDPELKRSLGDLRQIRDVCCSDDGIAIDVELLTPAYPDPDRLKVLIQEELQDEAAAGDQSPSASIRPCGAAMRAAASV